MLEGITQSAPWVQAIGVVGLVVALGLALLVGVDRAKLDDIRVLVTFALSAALISIAVIRSLQRIQRLPDPERYYISLPCTTGQVDDYIDILYDIFPDDAPPKKTLRAITNRELKLNPFGLVLIRDDNEAVVGGVEMYAMKEEFFKRYVDGEVSDPDIAVRDIATLEETINGRTLYVAVTIDDDLSHYKKGYILRHLLAAVGFVLENIYFPRIAIKRMSMYGLAASDEGRRLMGRLDFDKIREGGKRWERWWWLLPLRKEILPLHRLDIDEMALSDFRVKYPISLAELSLDVNGVLVDPRKEAAVHPKIEAVLARRSLAGAPT